ncbi:hypothetical protein RQP46_002396 [Phenoliferia psychrophenolica]
MLDRNQAEEAALATPLGEAFVHDSFERWRLTIWKDTRAFFLPFIHIPEFRDDLTLIFLDFDFDPAATTLRTQWRPRPGPSTMIPFRDLPQGYRTPGTGSIRNVTHPELHFSPLRVLLGRNWFLTSEGKETSFTHTFLLYGGETPSSLDPRNQQLDWLSAWWAFVQSKQKLDEKRSEIQLSLFGAAHFSNTEWSTLAKSYWTQLNPFQQDYLKGFYHSQIVTEDELASLAYLRMYEWGSIRGSPDSYVEESILRGY